MTETKRFRYTSLKAKPKVRRYLLYLIVAVAVVVTLAIFWWWPSWYADINLQTQLYSNKANADFINVYFLNFWVRVSFPSASRKYFSFGRSSVVPDLV